MNNQNYKISSPNSWFTKVGIKVDDNGNMVLPMKFVILPISIASEGLEKYKDDLLWGEKIKIIQSVALNIRNAETAYFEKWSYSILESNKETLPIFPCRECFNKTMSPSHLRLIASPQLSKLREEINKKIIHATENNFLVVPNIIDIVKNYYDEFLKLNLFYFSEIENIPVLFCKIHNKRKP